jgi:ATP-binding cassette, subfamily C (CFTR/MRP), member 1
MNKVVVQGRKDPIDLSSLPLPQDLHVNSAHAVFKTNWEAGKRHATDKKPVSLRNVMWRAFGSQLMVAGIFKVIWSVCVIM